MLIEHPLSTEKANDLISSFQLPAPQWQTAVTDYFKGQMQQNVDNFSFVEKHL